MADLTRDLEFEAMKFCTYDIPRFRDEPLHVKLRHRHVQIVNKLKKLLKALVCLCPRLCKRDKSSKQVAQLARIDQACSE